MLTKIILIPTLLALLLSVPAQAQNLEVRAGVFCDSQHEVERYVALFNGDAVTTMNAVNAEVKDATPCVAGTIALIRGPEVAAARTWHATFHIVQVLVVGIATTGGAKKVAPAVTYLIERVEEREA
jgi:hypothetical protein